MRPRTIAVWLSGLFCTALLTTAALAEPAPSYGDLLRQSEARAPRLIESAANVSAARGLAEQAEALPNPVLGFEVENLDYRDKQGIALQQSTLTVQQTLELGGKRPARAAAGRAEVDAALMRQRQARADLAYDLAIAYAAAEAAQARVVLLGGDLDRAREALRAAHALMDAGREADLRVVQAQASTTAAEADLAAARADAAEALARLTSTAGSPEAFTSVGASLLGLADTLPAPPAEPPAGSPAIIVAQAERDAADRRVRVERTRAVPDLTVSVGARRFPGQGDTAVVAGVSAPLPLFDRNRGAVRAANAQLGAAEARLYGARLEAAASWRAAASQATAGEVRLRAAVQGEAAAREAYDLSRIGYDGGKTSLMELLGARRALVEAQGRLIDVRLARIRAEAAIARLAGRTPFGE